jgi:fluoride exporter
MAGAGHQPLTPRSGRPGSVACAVVAGSVVFTGLRGSLIAIAAGGALGALVRTAASEWLPREPGQWPWVTLVVNLVGTALLAWSVAYLAHHPGPVLSFIGTGFCGALTSFSAFQVEAVQLFDEGSPIVAVSYLVTSVVLGVVASMAIIERSQVER